MEGTDVDLKELLATARFVADTELVEVDEVDSSEESKNLDSIVVSSRS